MPVVCMHVLPCIRGTTGLQNMLWALPVCITLVCMHVLPCIRGTTGLQNMLWALPVCITVVCMHVLPCIRGTTGLQNMLWGLPVCLTLATDACIYDASLRRWFEPTPLSCDSQRWFEPGMVRLWDGSSLRL